MNIKNNLRRKISKSLFDYQWFLVFDLNKKTSFSYEKFKKIFPPSGSYWADPFIVHENDLYYVFFEEFIHSKNKGHISFLTIDKNGNYSKAQKILEKPYHLSYPFIFNFEGEYYLLPESSENKTIEIYKCVNFPNCWVFHKILMSDIKATDSTLFYHNNKWWLFTNTINFHDEKTQNELLLFFSDNPLNNKWNPHPKNPVVKNKKGVRPAGKILNFEGKILRPSQDDTKRYGYGIVFNEIDILSEENYKETAIKTIYPDENKKIIGIHTFSREGNLTILDARIKKIKKFM